MSKRGDNPPDGEAGMTTAERRRYRRRGGGLRVPSDNVPRSPAMQRSTGAEDTVVENLNHFNNHDASDLAPGSLPIAPDSVPTVIDPPGDGVDDDEDFDTKTHEMAAVDLEALGLSDTATTLRIERVSPETVTTHAPAQRSQIDAALDVALHSIAAEPDPQRIAAAATAQRRAQTVALSEDDLEEVRGARAPSPPTAPPGGKPTTRPPPLSTVPPALARAPSGDDVGFAKQRDHAALSGQAVPQPVAHIATEPSGDIEVEIEDSAPVESETAAPPIGDTAIQAPRAQATPPAPPRADRKSMPAVDGTSSSRGGSGHVGAAGSDAQAGTSPPLAPPPTPAVGKSPPLPPQAKKPGSARSSTNRPDGKPAGSRIKPWFVDLFDEDYLRTLPFLTSQATQAEAEFVIDAMSLAPGAQVLDVGCGYGRHAMELAARGLHVVGLDLSTPLLVRGGEEAQRRGLTINFVHGDMRELDFENQFDAAYSLFSSFGYFEDETNKSTLLNIARALKPKGKILLEILNRDYLIADLPTRVWWEGDGCVVLEEVEFNYFSSRVLVNRSVVFDDGRQLEQEISVRAYSLHEVGKLMHAAGFRVLEVSGGYQMRGRFFGNQSRHIIVLAERKEPFAP